MITQDEFVALSQLLQRAPMSMAEVQWTQLFLVRLQASLAQQARIEAKEAEDSKSEVENAQQGVVDGG